MRSTYIILFYLKSTTFCCKDIEIKKSEFVAKTQFFLKRNLMSFSVNEVALVNRAIGEKHRLFERI